MFANLNLLPPTVKFSHLTEKLLSSIGHFYYLHPGRKLPRARSASGHRAPSFNRFILSQIITFLFASTTGSVSTILAVCLANTAAEPVDIVYTPIMSYSNTNPSTVTASHNAPIEISMAILWSAEIMAPSVYPGGLALDECKNYVPHLKSRTTTRCKSYGYIFPFVVSSGFQSRTGFNTVRNCH